MLQSLKKSGFLAALFAWGAVSASAFSLLGPFNEAYQQPIIGYNLGGDIGAPKNIGEDYRWNTPILYYAVDETFADYFGANGIAAVDQAFGVYNSLTNFSAYKPDLSDWPNTTQRVNHRAANLGLLDIKSAMLNLITEQMGLAEPDRWTWCLHARDPGPFCPLSAAYFVIQRNFDPLTYLYTSYVNGTLYSYYIVEFCSGPDPLAFCQPVPVDPSADTFTAVAAGIPAGGVFYTGLTRDDAGGLRYLMSTNRAHVEAVDGFSVMFETNQFNQLLFTSNYATFAAQALTNSAAAMQALYPGLQILNSSNYFGLQVTPVLTAFLTNVPWAPVGTLSVAIQTTYVTNIVTFYQHTFGNVVVNPTMASPGGTPAYTSGWVGTVQTSVHTANWGPIGSPLTTNVTVTAPVLTPGFTNGEFYILPPGLCAPYQILSTLLTTVTPVTNTAAQALIPPGVTNVTQASQSTVTWSTNHVFTAYPVSCASNSVALRQGIDRIQFYRKDFDSYLNRFWSPITNYYTMVSITNNQRSLQTIQRVIARPDFLISAQDITAGPSALALSVAARSISFNSNNALPALAGPGTIQAGGPGVGFIFSKVGPIYINPNLFFFPAPLVKNEATEQLIYLWGSFDGTTNAPIVYPDNTSLANLENQLFLQMTNAGPLPVGKVGVPYSAPLAANGSLPPPYSWSIPAASPLLPPGLTGLARAAVADSGSGVITISGTPTAAGFYDFIVLVADSSGRGVQRNFTLEIDP